MNTINDYKNKNTGNSISYHKNTMKPVSWNSTVRFLKDYPFSDSMYEYETCKNINQNLGFNDDFSSISYIHDNYGGHFGLCNDTRIVLNSFSTLYKRMNMIISNMKYIKYQHEVGR